MGVLSALLGQHNAAAALRLVKIFVRFWSNVEVRKKLKQNLKM